MSGSGRRFPARAGFARPRTTPAHARKARRATSGSLSTPRRGPAEALPRGPRGLESRRILGASGPDLCPAMSVSATRSRLERLSAVGAPPLRAASLPGRRRERALGRLQSEARFSHRLEQLTASLVSSFRISPRRRARSDPRSSSATASIIPLQARSTVVRSSARALRMSGGGTVRSTRSGGNGKR
jgi:hypothetical protein